MTTHSPTPKGSRTGFAAVTAVLFVMACAPKDVVILDVAPQPALPPALPGVDSVFSSMADAYARRGRMVDERAVETSRRAVVGGRRLFEIADSLTAAAESPTDSIEVSEDQMAESIRRYNEGARALQASQLGLAELKEAEGQFRLALASNPYDTEAIYWLSRVYELMVERMADARGMEDQIEVVKRLVELYPLRADYAALLASAYEEQGEGSGWADAGAWWHRASVLVRDEPELSLIAGATLDTNSTFVYLANASRAFIEADEAELALAAIEEMVPFAVDEDARAYVSSEREWLTWDADLQSRKRFDALLLLSGTDPAEAAAGLQDLLEDVTLAQAQVEVRYQLALALYNSGQSASGVSEIQGAWKDVAGMDTDLQDRIREDYGIMAYSIALEQRRAGELRNALAYLLQSEATEFSGAARSALTRSLLLRNDPEAALEAALGAESGWDTLELQDQRTLLEHLVDLHRRLGNRDRAVRYAQRYRDFVANTSQAQR